MKVPILSQSRQQTTQPRIVLTNNRASFSQTEAQKNRHQKPWFPLLFLSTTAKTMSMTTWVMLPSGLSTLKTANPNPDEAKTLRHDGREGLKFPTALHCQVHHNDHQVWKGEEEEIFPGNDFDPTRRAFLLGCLLEDPLPLILMKRNQSHFRFQKFLQVLVYQDAMHLLLKKIGSKKSVQLNLDETCEKVLNYYSK